MSISVETTQVELFGKFNQVYCPICLENLAKKEDTITLRCAHVFHTACQLRWPDACAVCRKPLKERVSEIASQEDSPQSPEEAENAEDARNAEIFERFVHRLRIGSI
jgi:hypothetical protein